MTGETLPVLAGPLLAAAGAVLIVLWVRRSAAARSSALADLRRRRRWRVEDRPSRGGAAATLTLAPEGGGWTLVVTYPRRGPGGGLSPGWITFRSPRPALARGRVVAARPLPGAGAMPQGAPARPAAALVLSQVLGDDLGREAGTLAPLPGDFGTVSLLAAPATEIAPGMAAALARAVAEWPEPAGLVLDAEGLRLRMAAGRDAPRRLEALADRGARLAADLAAVPP